MVSMRGMKGKLLGVSYSFDWIVEELRKKYAKLKNKQNKIANKFVSLNFTQNRGPFGCNKFNAVKTRGPKLVEQYNDP